METSTTTKVCRKCGKELPTSEFYKHPRNKDGLNSYCKRCQNRSSTEAHRKKRFNKIQTTQTGGVVPETFKVYAQKQPREIIDEIRDRINYLRSTGWHYEGKLTYTQIREVTL